MRVSPIGIFGATLSLDDVARMARADAILTHPNPICLDANALFTMAIATATRNPTTPDALYANSLDGMMPFGLVVVLVAVAPISARRPICARANCNWRRISSMGVARIVLGIAWIAAWSVFVFLGHDAGRILAGSHCWGLCRMVAQSKATFHEEDVGFPSGGALGCARCFCLRICFRVLRDSHAVLPPYDGL